MRFTLSLYRFATLFLMGGLAFAASGCQSRQAEDYSTTLTRIYLEESDHMPRERTLDMVLPLSETHITVKGKPSFAEWDIVYADYFDTDLGPAISLMFTPMAARDLYRETAGNQGRRLVLTINGLPLGARYIDRPIEDGRLAFYIEVDDDDVPEIVRNIQLTSRDIQERTQGRR